LDQQSNPRLPADVHSCPPNVRVAVRQGAGNFTNLYEAVTTAPGTLYFACQVASHCSKGQKIEVTVSLPPPAPPTSPLASSPSPPEGQEDSAAPRLAPGACWSVLLTVGASMAIWLL